MTVVHINTGSQPPNQPRFKLLTADHIKGFPPLEWRIKDVLPASGLAALYGPPSSGKSFLAIDMACAIADGGTWFGHVVKPSPVVYVALEGERGFSKRMKAWEQHNSRSCPPDLYFVLELFSLTKSTDVTDLASICPPGCVLIIDTLNRASPDLDENSSKDMSNVLGACKRLMKMTGGLILLIHHTGKDEARGLRGHSSLLAALDASIEVSRSLDQRAWCIAKSKDDTDEVWHGFKLAIEQVELDEDGDVVTSCAVEPAGDTKSTPAAQPTGKLQKLILGPIQSLIASSGQLNPAAPSPISITYSAALQCAIDNLAEIPSSHRASRARQTLDGLIHRNALKSNKDYIWL